MYHFTISWQYVTDLFCLNITDRNMSQLAGGGVGYWMIFEPIRSDSFSWIKRWNNETIPSYRRLQDCAICTFYMLYQGFWDIGHWQKNICPKMNYRMRCTILPCDSNIIRIYGVYHFTRQQFTMMVKWYDFCIWSFFKSAQHQQYFQGTFYRSLTLHHFLGNIYFSWHLYVSSRIQFGVKHISFSQNQILKPFHVMKSELYAH